jgi:hypothetical protein
MIPLWKNRDHVLLWFGPAYDTVQLSYRLALIPGPLQGRVNSAFRLIAQGMRPLGRGRHDHRALRLARRHGAADDTELPRPARPALVEAAAVGRTGDRR